MNLSGHRPDRIRRCGPSLIVAFIAAISLVGAAGCGSSDSKAPEAVVSETFTQPHDYSSGVLDAGLSIKGGGLTGGGNGLGLTLQGPWASKGKGALPSFSMDTDLTLGSRDVRVKLISDGQSGWVDFAGLTYRLPDSVFSGFKEAFTGGTGKGAADGPLLDRLGFKPSEWIKDPQTIGEEKVEGVDTVHVRADLDASKLIADLDSVLSAADKAGGGLLSVPALGDAVVGQMANSVEEARFDVWSGKQDGTLRKLTVTVRTKQAGPVPPLDLDFHVTLGQLNSPQQIEIPKNAGSFSGIAGLLAGAAGLGGSDSGGEDPAAKAYSECVGKAKDRAEVTACLEGLVK